MSNNSIDAEVRLKTIGAEEAAAEIKKVEVATTEAVKTTEKLDDNVEKIARAQQAEAFGKAADKVGEYAKKIAALGEDLDKTFGKEAADKIRETAGAIEQISSGASSVATAVAAGGPIAGGILGIGLLIKEAVVAWQSMNTAADNETAAVQRSLEMMNKLQDARRTHAEDMQKQDVLDAMQSELDKLTETVDKQKEYNELRAELNKLAAATRDKEDAEAVRAGANPFDVKIKRAADDAAEAKRQIDDTIEQKRQAQEVAARALAIANTDKSNKDQNPATSDKDKADAVKAVEEAQKKFNAANSEFTSAAAKGEVQKQVIDTRAEIKVVDLYGQKTATQKQQEESAAQKQKQETERADAAARRRAQEEQRQTETAAGLGQSAEKLLPTDVSVRFRNAVEKASSKLQDGGTAAEIDELTGLLTQLASSTNAALNGTRTEITRLKSELAILRKNHGNR